MEWIKMNDEISNKKYEDLFCLRFYTSYSSIWLGLLGEGSEGQRSSCSASPCVREKRRTGERSTGEEGEAGRLGWIDLIRSKSSLIDDGVRGKIGSSSAQ